MVGIRYYAHAGVTIAVRQGSTVTWLAADHHGTHQFAVAAEDLAVTRRRTLPFGQLRDTVPTVWPGEKGFVGGTIDASTGLTHVGAREYDPAVGRFVSVDPIMDLADPQQMHGYTYANNNPTTWSDPSGLKIADCEQYHTNCTTGGNLTSSSEVLMADGSTAPSRLILRPIIYILNALTQRQVRFSRTGTSIGLKVVPDEKAC